MRTWWMRTATWCGGGWRESMTAMWPLLCVEVFWPLLLCFGRHYVVIVVIMI